MCLHELVIQHQCSYHIYLDIMCDLSQSRSHENMVGKWFQNVLLLTRTPVLGYVPYNLFCSTGECACGKVELNS